MSNHVLFPEVENYKWQGDPDVAITGSGFSVPRGIESNFSYNGVVFNDLTVYDKYRVLAIDGLADPDVRDNREDKTGDDGEDAYGNLYSGRTLVMKIRVEAYSLDKLRDMEEALRTAFVNMNEMPLYFLTGDPEKDHYINCKKSAALTKEEDVSTLDYKHFREWQVTLRASDPRFYRVKGKYLTSIIDIADPEFNEYKTFETGSLGSMGYVINSTSGVYSSAISSDWAAGGTKSMKIESDLSDGNTKKLWKKFDTNVYGGTSYTFSGDVNFTSEASGLLYGPATITPILFFLNSSDGIIGYIQAPAKSIGTLAFNEIFNFSVSGIAPMSCQGLLLELRVEYNWPWTMYVDNLSVRHTHPYSEEGTAHLSNIGNYNTKPIIKLAGEMANVTIWNDSAPEPFNMIKFKDTVTIAEDDIYTINVEKKTIVDKTGANKIGDLDRTSGWLKLYPGDNVIYLDTDTTFGTSGDEQFVFQWKDAWI